MDRCRCEEYMCAVERLEHYIPGTLRPDIIKNFNSGGVYVRWVKGSVGDYGSFTRPKVWRIEGYIDPLSEEARRVEHMWCNHMSKYHSDRRMKPAVGLEDQMPPDNRRITHPELCRKCEKRDDKP